MERCTEPVRHPADQTPVVNVMTLWTIQPLAAWAELQDKGVLRARSDNVSEPAWMPAYRWMTGQMGSRIGPPPEADSQAIWAWYRWDGATKTPDLRRAGHLMRGEKGVRLEIDYPNDQVLLSDFSLWHYVLNYWYLPSSEADGEAFESELAGRGLSFIHQKPLPDDTYHRAIVDSWDRCFDLERHEPGVSEREEDKSIQATIWEITLDQVNECRHFTAR